MFGRTKGGDEKVISPHTFILRGHIAPQVTLEEVVFFQVCFGWLSTVCLSAVRTIDHEIILLCDCGTMA